jgi:hypothetical protein
MKEYIGYKSDRNKYESIIKAIDFREALIICYEHENSIFRLCTDRVNLNNEKERELWEFKFYGINDFIREYGLNDNMNKISDIYMSRNNTASLCINDISVSCKNNILCSAVINVNMAFGGIRFDFSDLELKMIETTAVFNNESQDWLYTKIGTSEVIDFYNPFEW